jgi:hypothetical protein
MNRRRQSRIATAVFFCLASTASAQVTSERLVNSAKEPQNWMTYSGDYSGKRFSALDQITTATAPSLVVKWVYQLGSTGKTETSPLEVDGVLYATGPDDRAFALDARTGRPLWIYQRQLPSDIRPCCGRVNRGLAILGGKVFMGTLDAHVVALDAKTGAVIWDVTAADYRTGHTFTVAPLAVKNLIILGVSAANTAFADLSTPMMPPPGSASGASTRFRLRANRGTTPGRENRGKSVALRPGIPARTIPARICSTGLREILPHRIVAPGAREITCTAIPC